MNTVFKVKVPDGVRPGQEFSVHAGTRIIRVKCPANYTPGQRLSITVPNDPNIAPLPNPPPPPLTHHQQQQQATPPEAETTQVFEVTVPNNVIPGQALALLAGGVRVQVTCPQNATPGSKIRFELPIASTQRPKKHPITEAAAQRLLYDKDGWTRTIRVSDMKLQWIRMDDNGNLDNNYIMSNNKFDTEKSAYVRKLEFREGSDSRIRDGILTLVPANEGIVDSCIQRLVTYSEIAQIQGKCFQDKAKWFQEKCKNNLAISWNEGHMRINVRRKNLLEDSVDAVMSLSRKDFRKSWRFEFIGEVGIDAGGLAREWFQLITNIMFDPDLGFWQPSEANQICMQINPASKVIDHDYLEYYRFLGRVMGKALFDSQLIAGHMVPFIYKHMLGWPITFKDIKTYDEEYYESLVQVKKMAVNGDDIEMILCLPFTTTVDILGAKEDVDLIPGGADIPVTNDNYHEYLEACLKYRMLECVKPQLNELLLGFFDVIPEPLLTVFDFQELELLMCGLPEIDILDWQAHTEYSGDYEHIGGANYPVCQWFWDVVEEFDQEMKARLLQFVTGTSGVPSRGFGVLQGNDGNIRKFTIHGVPVSTCLYPRAHTCFNRIDLPTYENKDELREKLKLAVTMVATGFDIE